MNLCVVEIKNKDLFVVYDTDGGGVCCCTLYTLKQLVTEYKVNIKGFELSHNGKYKVWECLFNGVKRQNKAPSMCNDETKRSATTIVKGLSCKKYPRVKQVRTKQHSENNKKVGTLFSFKIDMGIDDIGYLTLDNMVVTLRGRVIPYSEFTQLEHKIIQKGDLTDLESQCLSNLIRKYNLILAYRKKIATLRQEILNNETAIKEVEKEVADLVAQYEIELAESQVTGDEEFEMSFRDYFDKAKLIAIIKKTKRIITYTSGISYRNPVCKDEIISKEYAIHLVKTESLLVAKSFKDKIHINIYSGSDMW